MAFRGQNILIFLELFEECRANVWLVVRDGFAVDAFGLVGTRGRSGSDLWFVLYRDVGRDSINGAHDNRGRGVGRVRGGYFQQVTLMNDFSRRA